MILYEAGALGRALETVLGVFLIELRRMGLIRIAIVRLGARVQAKRVELLFNTAAVESLCLRLIWASIPVSRCCL